VRDRRYREVSKGKATTSNLYSLTPFLAFCKLADFLDIAKIRNGWSLLALSMSVKCKNCILSPPWLATGSAGNDGSSFGVTPEVIP
jgi:hypothetical protein